MQLAADMFNALMTSEFIGCLYGHLLFTIGLAIVGSALVRRFIAWTN